MITIFFDLQSKRPIYEQLYKHIKNEIEQGALIQNEKLPSKRKLAEHLKISAVSVETAYAQLLTEGYIRSVEKSGYFVDAAPFPPFKATPLVTSLIPIVHEPHYDIDFKTSVVDTELFPNTVWAKLARTVLSENTHEVLNVMHPQGQRNLREAIAVYLFRFRGIQADPEQIVVGAGSEMLYTLLIQLLGRNHLFATENPGYLKIRQILQANELDPIAIPLDQQGISVDKLSKSSAHVVHVTPSHQFPSGIVMPIKRRMELLEWANESLNRYIIEDDYDSEFSVTNQPIPALQGLDHHEKVIYLNSFTKSIAPSLRIGYLVLPLHLLKKYRENQTFGACTVPAFEQAILAKFMMEGYFERHLNRMRIAYKKKRDYLIERLIASGIAGKNDIIGSDAGLHFLLKVRNGMSEEALIQEAKNASIRLYGLSEYMIGKEVSSEPTLVVGYSGLTESLIDQAIERLVQVWKI